MNSIPEKIVERIKKLLRLAGDDGAAEGEIENAMRFAKKLMAEHNLEEHAIVLEEDVDDVAARIVDQMIYSVANAVPRWKRDLAQIAAKVCGCRIYWNTQFDIGAASGGRKCIHLYGMEEDCAVATALFRELCVTLQTLARVRCGKGWTASHGSYAIGVISKLQSRAWEQIPAEENPTCTAIVLKKDAALDQFRDNIGIKTVAARRRTIADGDAYARGREDGSNINLGVNGIPEGSPKKRPNRIGR